MIGAKSLLAAFLLATDALAGPLANGNDLDKRQCSGPIVETTTIYSPSTVIITGLSTTTESVTATVYSNVKSTVTEVYTNTITKTKSVTTDVVTVPSTTQWEFPIVATVTTDPYGVFTVTTTVPGTPDPCYTLTCTKIISDAKTSTYSLLYDYTIVTYTAKTTTVTKLIPKTITSKLLVGKSTTTLTTITSTIPQTSSVFIFESVVKTAYSTPGPATCGA
ncbi:hypothetical protein TWF694_011119 [Orbilia ellipsospora]|uniref:Uncharacterized protein n=1 Tax=Orbilia ellipsospora TaxID=2528407 RepID=A0AAV9X831_9PEZI